MNQLFETNSLNLEQFSSKIYTRISSLDRELLSVSGRLCQTEGEDVSLDGLKTKKMQIFPNLIKERPSVLGQVCRLKRVWPIVDAGKIGPENLKETFQ